MSVVLCWFQRNLRLDDNVTLAAAMRAADAVLPVFVLDPCRAEASPLARRIQRDSLRELAALLSERGSGLVIRRGAAERVLADLVRETGADGVFGHADHESSSRLQQARVREALAPMGVRLHLSEELLLVPATTLRTQSGKPFTVFTPFFKRWLEADKPAPVPDPMQLATPPAMLRIALSREPLADEPEDLAALPPFGARGGIRAAAERWGRFRDDALSGYAEGRDRPDRPGTSRLSLDLRPGTLGIRRLHAEVRAFSKDSVPEARASAETFIKELAWREFFAGILEAFPGVELASFRPEFERFPWVSGDEENVRLAAWVQGRTGYPIVDAGMRQLLEEGWMHNRVRMIVASFLTKDLLVHWGRGEAHFMSVLGDGDLAANNGGWQWAAGSGCDAQPFFRIFNPVRQGERFDPEGRYVRQYVRELANLPGPGIHAPWLLPETPSLYPRPIVDHAQARSRALAAFAQLRA